jgi:predicted dithiol-disulfide oxidoreductase (DUF899 family)
MNPEIREIMTQLEALHHKLADARRRASSPRPVDDYEFRRADGSPVRLSQLFGAKRDLLVVHNMGKRCSYCTMWADGFNGLRHHLSDRAAFVLASPDEPETMRAFAASRGWQHTMVSTAESPFNHDMGFEPERGSVWPGVTSFHKSDDGAIERISSAQFGPGDGYCAVWPMLDLLKDGPAGWEPRTVYGHVEHG